MIVVYGEGLWALSVHHGGETINTRGGNHSGVNDPWKFYPHRVLSHEVGLEWVTICVLAWNIAKRVRHC